MGGGRGEEGDGDLDAAAVEPVLLDPVDEGLEIGVVPIGDNHLVQLLLQLPLQLQRANNAIGAPFFRDSEPTIKLEPLEI